LKRSVIGYAKNPAQTTVTEIPDGASNARIA